MRERLHFLFLNIGHFVDHYATLIFATAAALALTREWGLSYAELAPYATPGFVAFGLFSLPAGWLADRWSRPGMMALFFLGIGAAMMLTGLARSPLQIGIGMFVIGMFAAIYHPVGLALVMANAPKAGMAIAVNGVWGNLGVAAAALVTGFFIDNGGWRSAFIVPGIATMGSGIVYCWLFWDRVTVRNATAGGVKAATAAVREKSPAQRHMLIVAANIFVILMMSGFIFQSTSFALPKVFDERGAGTISATTVGWMTFLVFAVGSLAQLVIGPLLDRMSSRLLLVAVAAIQILFFALMPGLGGWGAVLVAIGFMLGAFGQLPISDFMVGKMARSELRSSVYGARYVVTCTVFATAIPVIAWIHSQWGFDALFRVLTVVAIAMLGVILLLPGKLPEPEPLAAAKPAPAE